MSPSPWQIVSEGTGRAMSGETARLGVVATPSAPPMGRQQRVQSAFATFHMTSTGQNPGPILS
jgi:hypothetical protein